MVIFLTLANFQLGFCRLCEAVMLSSTIAGQTYPPLLFRWFTVYVRDVWVTFTPEKLAPKLIPVLNTRTQ